MSSTSSNPLPISLPRFSPAALLLALALAAMLSMVVGIAAYTVHTGSGISQADLAAAQHNAYQSGHDAGYTAGLAKGKDHFDKRDAIKKRDQARDVQRELRDVGR